MSSLSKWLRKYKSQLKEKYLFLICIPVRVQLHEHHVSFHRADEDQVLWSVLRNSVTLCGTGCGPKLSDYSNQCESKAMYLTSGVVRKCDGSSSERLSRKVPIPKAIRTLFEGRKKVLIVKINPWVSLANILERSLPAFFSIIFFLFPGSRRG